MYVKHTHTRELFGNEFLQSSSYWHSPLPIHVHHSDYGTHSWRQYYVTGSPNLSCLECGCHHIQPLSPHPLPLVKEISSSMGYLILWQPLSWHRIRELLDRWQAEPHSFWPLPTQLPPPSHHLSALSSASHLTLECLLLAPLYTPFTSQPPGNLGNSQVVNLPASHQHWPSMGLYWAGLALVLGQH